MSNPRFYSVQAGDTFTSIALRVYGVAEKESLIRQANINIKELIPGDILIIPLLSVDRKPQKKLNKSSEIITVFIGDIELNVLSARIIISLDNMVFAWSARIPWEMGDNRKLDKLLIPFTYPDASIYMGNDRIINGFLYTVTPQKTIDGIFMNLTGYSFTADIMDSELKPPFEVKKINLLDRAKQLVSPLGIDVLLDSESGVNPGGIFDRVTADAGDTIGKHLMNLATQRGVLLSSNEDGNLLITKTKTTEFAGLISEDLSGVKTWGATFDGRKRFNSYRVYGQSPGGNAKEAVSIDKNIIKTRFTSFNTTDTIKGELQTIADWKKTTQIKEALQLALTVNDWFADSGARWKHNTVVKIISPTLFLPQGFDFLIKSVEYILTDEGRSTILNLVPLQVFTGEELIDPWGNE
jgi:prophage tail gpP-like protein